MLLIYDMNLSPRLVLKLDDIFPDSEHVSNIGMGESDDPDIWEYAKEKGYTIVTKDSDFYDSALVKGYPPKIIWLRCGNAPTKVIESILRENEEVIKRFIMKSSQSYLQLFS